MENNKIINFHLYRYHLLPIDNKNKQLQLFSVEETLTYEQIKQRKNEFFDYVLKSICNVKENTHPLKLEHNEETYFIFKIAQKKTRNITKNFQKSSIIDEPYVYIIINNNSEIQKIAISENIEAFSNPIVVRNILKKTFNRDLQKYGLNIEIEQLFDSQEFWNIVEKENQKGITFIDFKYVKPNMANIASSLPDVFRQFSENTNSHESQISIKAAENGILENIDRNNHNIVGLAEYISKGGGNIRVKAKGIKKYFNTEEHPVIFEAKEIEIEGAATDIFQFYKTIVK